MIALFCFYNISNGPQACLAFSKKFRHCNIITYDGETYLALEMDKTGILTRQINPPSTRALIRGLKHIDSLVAIVTVDVHEREKVFWKPFVVRSCNEVDRYITGVNVGFTFNPKHLYNKLIKNNHTNYDILDHWSK